MSKMQDRIEELVREEGYDRDQAIEIAADEKGAQDFYDGKDLPSLQKNDGG
jgi:hypothetical protein